MSHCSSHQGTMPPRQGRFPFEASWLTQQGFMEMVRQRWLEAAATPPRAYRVTVIWHHGSHLTHRFMRVWGANLGTESRARKASLLAQLKDLDAMADSMGISADD
ncbi:hypothetical protein D1007_38498 [Hordeum vulgare]|nr:hypothetical protein D1007_38498 [Hordeum vulgare]